jgi:hypothetical protein
MTDDPRRFYAPITNSPWPEPPRFGRAWLRWRWRNFAAGFEAIRQEARVSFPIVGNDRQWYRVYIAKSPDNIWYTVIARNGRCWSICGTRSTFADAVEVAIASLANDDDIGGIRKILDKRSLAWPVVRALMARARDSQ